MLDHVPTDGIELGLRGMLGGHHHGVDAAGFVVFVVLHRDLGLPVRAQVRQQAGFPDLCEAPGHFLCKAQGQGHKLRRLVAGIAEHHPLVSGAVFRFGVRIALLLLKALVHAHGNVWRLLVDGSHHGAGVAVHAVFGAVVPDILQNDPGDFGDIHVAARADLAHHENEAGRGCALAGNMPVRVFPEDLVKDRVGDLVADLIGVSLRDGFGCKQIMSHVYFCLLGN